MENAGHISLVPIMSRSFTIFVDCVHPRGYPQFLMHGLVDIQWIIQHWSTMETLNREPMWYLIFAFRHPLGKCRLGGYYILRLPGALYPEWLHRPSWVRFVSRSSSRNSSAGPIRRSTSTVFHSAGGSCHCIWAFRGIPFALCSCSPFPSCLGVPFSIGDGGGGNAIGTTCQTKPRNHVLEECVYKLRRLCCCEGR